MWCQIKPYECDIRSNPVNVISDHACYVNFREVYNHRVLYQLCKKILTFGFVFLTDSINYIVHIKTGSKLTAGTDANVIITIYGEDGETDERKLDNAGNNFERNKYVIFTSFAE